MALMLRMYIELIKPINPMITLTSVTDGGAEHKK